LLCCLSSWHSGQAQHGRNAYHADVTVDEDVAFTDETRDDRFTEVASKRY